METLTIVGTPIGNLGDLTRRATEALAKADIVVCEDTRRTGQLLHILGFKKQLIPYNDVNERRQAAKVLALLRRGMHVVLVSDAGMPLLCDPGYTLVQLCIGAQIPVHVVPGPSAATTALVISGLPPYPYFFVGYPPKTKSKRERLWQNLAKVWGIVPVTIVLYIPLHSLEEVTAELLAAVGNRPAVLARELTKLHEEIYRGDLANVLEKIKVRKLKGEITLLLGALQER